MEHSLFPLEFQLPDGKDTLQAAQNVINLKFNHFANVSAVYLFSIKNSMLSIILQMLSAVYMLLIV